MDLPDGSLSFSTVSALFFIGYVIVAAIAVLSQKSGPKYYGQTKGEPSGPGDVEEMSRGKRIAAIVFLSVWLFGWTFGVLLALQTRIGLSPGDEGYIFLTIWLAGGIPSWFFVACILFRLYRGDHIDMQFDGDGDSGGGD